METYWQKFFGFYQRLNWLSIDIVMGVMVCACFFLRIHQLPIPWLLIIILGLSVWSIYTADHLIDVWRIRNFSTERHAFHRQHVTALLLVLTAVLLVMSVLLFYVSASDIFWGILLFSLLILYFFLREYVPLMKEIGLTILYVSGIFFPTLRSVPSSWSVLHRADSLFFIGIVFLNALIFSEYERPFDEENDFYSAGVLFGGWLRAGVYGLFTVLIVFGIYAMDKNPIRSSILLEWLMLFCLFAIHWMPQRFKKNSLYRIIGDGIFLLPSLFLLYTA